MRVRSTEHSATFPVMTSVMTSVVFSTSSTPPSVVNTTYLRTRRRNGLDMFTLRRYYESDVYVYYGTISPIINSFVLLLNVLLIATIIRGKFRTSTYVKIIAISICDSLSGLVPLPFNVYVFGLKNEMGYLSLPWCYMFDFLQMILPEVFHLSSLYLNVGLAIERYIVVSFPVKAKRICTVKYGVIFSIAIVVVSICSQIDLFLQVEYKVRSFKSETYNATINECSRTARVRTNTEYMIRTMFVVFLPCLILLFFTIMLIYKTKKIRRWRKLNTCKSGVKSRNVTVLDRMNMAVILILVVVIISEVTVWTGLLLSRVHNVRFTHTHEDMMGIGHVIFQITSSFTLMILCCLSEDFRQQFKRTVFRCCLQKDKFICCYQHHSSNRAYIVNHSLTSSKDNTRF